MFDFLFSELQNKVGVSPDINQSGLAVKERCQISIA
jgi:hypothetical protein